MNIYLFSDSCVNHTTLVTLNLKDESVGYSVATQFSTEMVNVKNNTKLCVPQAPGVFVADVRKVPFCSPAEIEGKICSPKRVRYKV